MSVMHPLTEVEEVQDEFSMPHFKIQSRIKIDLIEYALIIENIMSEVLVTAVPVGLYSRQHLEPVLRQDRTYHQLQAVGGVEEKVFVKADQLDKLLPSAIYDENSRTVVPAYIARNPKHNLSLQSFHPYWGMKIALMMVNWRLTCRAPWVRNKRDSMDELLDYMPPLQQAIEAARQKIDNLPEQTWPIDEELEALHHAAKDDLGAQQAHHQNFYTIMEDCIRDLLRMVDGFVGNDVWNHYFVKQRGSSIIIEKADDYRILQWEQEHGHEFR